jgi:hypothetical protein
MGNERLHSAGDGNRFMGVDLYSEERLENVREVGE